MLEAVDAIGDCTVVLTILAAQLGVIVALPEQKKDTYRTLPESRTTDLDIKLGALAGIIARGKQAEYAGALSEAIAVLPQIASTLYLDYVECVGGAWEEIKDRKGRMVDGVFVREEAQAA